MDETHPRPPPLDEDAALRLILEGTAPETGERFFSALVRNLARAMDTHGAWVTEYLEEQRRLRALAFWLGGEWIEDYEYGIDGTPCATVIDKVELLHIPDRIVELFPDDPDLAEFDAVSYMGVPLTGTDGTVLGHLAVLDDEPMPEEPRGLALLQIFAARAGAELRRLHVEARLRERDRELTGLLDSAMDAIIELDGELRVCRVNPAAEKLFGIAADRFVERDFGRLLDRESRVRLRGLIDELEGRPADRRHLWVPGTLTGVRSGGIEFPAEATLASFELGGRTLHTLILRDVNDRFAAERKIRTLTREAEYLREEIRSLEGFDELIGESESFLRALQDVDRVAGTGATVLLTGETGTGKELIARAIHTRSDRANRPLIRVNCAAIPANLIESEFFGHEKGAFTGATARREGRFALADGGTIFLDEVGELPLDLQAKLLRVLQEGEFEPVGASRTRTVDVRIIAATNRDLRQAVSNGRFREDLFYRLNVFPIRLPPLRERGNDVLLLARGFARKLAGRLGRTIEPPDRARERRLLAYDWPGNVRELQNVIERAIITSDDGRLNLDRALPRTGVAEHPPAERSADAAPDPAASGDRPAVLTDRELKALERENLIRALESADWKVSGAGGAAELLGIPPSTLASRMKALGITRPGAPDRG